MCNIRKRRVNTSGERRENLWEGGGNIYYIHIHTHTYIYIYICVCVYKERTITMSSLIIPKYTGAAILLSCRNFINSYRRGFFVQLFSIVACINRYLFRENIVDFQGRIPFVFLVCFGSQELEMRPMKRQ